MAGGEFNGDDEEGEGHIYSAESPKRMAEYRVCWPPPSALSNRSVSTHMIVDDLLSYDRKGLSILGSKNI